jgi:hypothetical protein
VAGIPGGATFSGMTQPLRDLDDVSAFKLSEQGRERLFELTSECIVCWTNSSGWPVGMPHSFVWSDGKFWVHTTTKRARVKALTARPESCVVVTSKGTEMRGAMVTAKTRATVHHGDRDLVRWLLPLFFDRVGMGPDAQSRAQLMELFDTPARVVIEFSPVETFTYSAVEMDDAIASSGFDQWGRRGPADPDA